MSTAALRWIRTLTDTSSWRAKQEPPPSSISGTHIRRVSLHPDIPDSAVVWPESASASDGEPRFAEEERGTRISTDLLRPPSSPPREAERRANDRTPFLADLEFGEDAQFFTGLSLDISEGGLFVSTYTEIPLGTRLVLAFELPDGTAVEARGEVRWRRTHAMDGERPGIGIAFTDLPEDARARIVALCERRPPLYFDV
jgi:uncharacterized protein (TIGR02266 family)